jgi:hypothetical protein
MGEPKCFEISCSFVFFRGCKTFLDQSFSSSNWPAMAQFSYGVSSMEMVV